MTPSDYSRYLHRPRMQDHHYASSSMLYAKYGKIYKDQREIFSATRDIEEIMSNLLDELAINGMEHDDRLQIMMKIDVMRDAYLDDGIDDLVEATLLAKKHVVDDDK